MLTVFSNDMGEFLEELERNSEAAAIERYEIRVCGERRLTTDPNTFMLVIICTYVCNGLLHRLEVPCGNIIPGGDTERHKRTEERYDELHAGLKQVATNAALRMNGGLLEVRVTS